MHLGYCALNFNIKLFCFLISKEEAGEDTDPAGGVEKNRENFANKGIDIFLGSVVWFFSYK